MDIEQFNINHGKGGQLKCFKGKGGFPFIQVNNRSASALISVYAAQVLSFKPTSESEDLLFVSKKSHFRRGKAIRGGIPVCWPWFGSDPSSLNRPNHGFARQGLWSVVGTNAQNADETQVRLRFTETLTETIGWQQGFVLELAISISNTLTLELVTRNTGTQQFSITQAFHSYFHIGHIRQVQVYGLENTVYVDKLADGKHQRQQGNVTVSAAIDRIYTNVHNELVIDDLAFKRKIQITSTNSKTAVVWNPWATHSANIADLDADDYQRFICVEAGNVDQDVIHIEPDSEYRLRTQFKITRSE